MCLHYIPTHENIQSDFIEIIDRERRIHPYIPYYSISYVYVIPLCIYSLSFSLSLSLYLLSSSLFAIGIGVHVVNCTACMKCWSLLNVFLFVSVICLHLKYQELSHAAVGLIRERETYITTMWRKIYLEFLFSIETLLNIL